MTDENKLTLRDKLILRILLLCAEMIASDEKLKTKVCNLSFEIRTEAK